MVGDSAWLGNEHSLCSRPSLRNRRLINHGEGNGVLHLLPLAFGAVEEENIATSLRVASLAASLEGGHTECLLLDARVRPYSITVFAVRREHLGLVYAVARPKADLAVLAADALDVHNLLIPG